MTTPTEPLPEPLPGLAAPPPPARVRIRRKSLARPLIFSAIFVAVTVAATSVLGLSIASTSAGGSTATYYARFADVTGVRAGDDIDIAGVRVGQVTSVGVVDRNQAQVGFAIDKSRALPASVTAAIFYRDLIGDRYLELAPGPGAPGQSLRPGSVIPLAQTTPALDLTELFNGFQPLFQALSPGDVNQLSAEIIQVLQGEGTTMDTLLTNVGSVTTTLAKRGQVIDSVIRNLNGVVTTINNKGGELSTLVTTLQQLVSGLAQDRKPIGDAIGAMSNLTNATAGLLQQANPPVTADIKALSRLSGNLAASAPAIAAALQDLPKTQTDIARLSSYGSWFNLYMCRASVSGVQEAYGPPPTGIPVTAARCKA
jgi:phospholipid/cholesterol/gamma-HCH transport system substrate-binding protein